ncbi:hypothetical protein [Mucilaginibacter jinjuensis]|uniref:Uncharacterized protein n=1 Tax=Mucilaginibacter jinjuensis TaxID=1176721 RepID=A0ABY7TAA3_9SPHI|nr:hypothetical protein [Mucilaginibacter jinjuensis]WCT13119.1 hypothetical protein PQO05_04120 [Mucilaginibacter jinjuensis]
MDLSKKDKKAAREIIAKGMHAEFQRGMQHFDIIMQKWRESKDEDQIHYAELYGEVRQFDKRIAFRYDRLSGSIYLDTIIIQIIEKLIDLSDLNLLSTETQEYIIQSLKNRTL